MTTYLGFSCSQHDPAIAVVDASGEVLFAEANERPLKCKRGWHAPPDALGVIEPLLDRFVADGSISANLTWSRGALRTVGLMQTLAGAATAAITATNRADRDSLLWRARVGRHALYRAPPSAAHLLWNLDLRLRERRGSVAAVRKGAWNHHLCHAAAACFSSHFEEALCVVVDGMGEASSTAVFGYRDGALQRLDTAILPNIASLGWFYSQACFAAGFDPIAGEEWKLMGLAAYGRKDPAIYARLRPILTAHGGRLANAVGYSAILQEFMPLRSRPPLENADFACTVQAVFEDVLCEFLTACRERWGGDNLVLTGGCSLNSSANGKVVARTGFRDLHVPMAPGDDGNAVGAALLAWQADNGGRRPPRCASPFLGSAVDPATLDRLRNLGMRPQLTASSEQALADAVARELAAGRIVGWMQGRAEFGPRALGNRSILADPRPANVKDRLNATVKFREEFRPFAPSVLHEHGDAFFEDYVSSPYMERTLRWRPGLAPDGVRHLDGTGRLQSVTAESNPLFHRLLTSFHAITGLPILLNTSFNVMGRPMVHDVEDALGVFLTSGMDVLVIGDSVFGK